jgi:prevent-host-death family protein
VIVSTTVNVHEAKTQLSQLLERARAGEEIILAKAGKPYAKLVPVNRKRERLPGLAKGRLTDAFFEPLPADEIAAWEK